MFGSPVGVDEDHRPYPARHRLPEPEPAPEPEVELPADRLIGEGPTRLLPDLRHANVGTLPRRAAGVALAVEMEHQPAEVVVPRDSLLSWLLGRWT